MYGIYKPKQSSWNMYKQNDKPGIYKPKQITRNI